MKIFFRKNTRRRAMKCPLKKGCREGVP